jgi:lipopolysaccharide export LptBFGC system permease protein LptF
VFAECESEEDKRKIHASQRLALPPFSHLAEALGVLAVSSQNLNRRRGSSAAPFFIATLLYWFVVLGGSRIAANTSVIISACDGGKSKGI